MRELGAYRFHHPIIHALLFTAEIDADQYLRALVIAECTCPSLGVGYELAFAEAHQKPCYVLYRKSRTQLSAMLLGNPYFHIVPYETETEAFSALDRILQ